MSVSVIVPTLNRWAFLDECLSSIAAQTDTAWEAIVVNDGSYEPDLEGVRARWSDARFRWIDHEKPRGIGSARNAGIQAARYPLVLLVDNDDLLAPECVARLRPVLDDPEIDCAFSDFEFFGAVSLIHSFQDLPLSRLAESQFIPAQVLMRKALWERVQGYSDEQAFVHGNEDWDFWISAAEVGFRYHHLRETLYRYRVHAGGLSKTSLVREDYRTRETMYRRHRAFFDQHTNRRSFLAPGYWRSAGAYCQRGTLLKSLLLGGRAFLLSGDAALARDLARRILQRAVGLSSSSA